MATFRSFRPRPEAATHRENRFAGPGLSLPRHPPAVRALATRRPVLVQRSDADSEEQRARNPWRSINAGPPIVALHDAVFTRQRTCS